jgi:hypothetical protein
MFKTLALAALLGFAASRSVASWEDGDNLVDSDWFKLDWMLQFDFGYGTHWGVVQSALADNDGDLLALDKYYTEYYGGHIYTEGILSFTSTMMKHRKLMVEYELVPLYVAPYRQYVSFARLHDDAGMDNQFGLHIAGAREIQMMEFTTTYTENVKTTKVSIWDYIDDERDELAPQDGEWTYNEDYEEEWEDEYWSFNVLTELDNDLTTNDWYGLVAYMSDYIVEPDM